MMEDCEEAKVFSVRIVTMDYYMSPPIPNLDISYSTFQGGKVNEVPVIRIYGSTPAGQKTCLHVHRALPYLYIPCADLKLPLELQGDARTNLISKIIEKALKLKGAGSKRQHVHGCSLVRAKRLYGYYKSDEVFAKIYLYRPQDVSRAANLLLEGGVFDRSVQPHESHIPFLLQFLVDYNLYGMAHLHVSKLKFRQPVPNVTTQRKISSEGVRDGLESQPYMSSGSPKDSSGNLKTSSPIWISSTIPDSWMWQSPSQLDSHLFKHQSSSELEGDAIVNDILNQQNNIYTTLSQTSSDVKMVQSLIPIWEEEYERSGMHEAALFCDTDKPLPEDVLKTLSNGLDFYNQIFDLYNETEKNSSPLPFENDVGSAECRTDLTNNGNMVRLVDSEKDGIRAKEFLKIDELVNLLPNNSSCEDAMVDDTQSQAFETIGSLDAKVVDKEAIGLLSWLASSQAGEDINSDDELAFETILSPLLPATSMDKVLEKANVNFESESQKECQDILDSVDIDHGDLNETSSSTDQNHLNYSCSEKIIPQVDGSSDDRNLVPDTDESQEEYSCNENVVLSHVNVASESSSGSKAKNVLRKSLWGSLPFSSNQNVDTIKSSKLEFEGDAINNESKAETGLVGCSVRDLMRRKRRPLFEPYKNDSKNFRHASLEEEQDIPKELEVYAMAYSKEEEGSQEIEAINENRYRKKLSSNSFEKVSSVILTYPHHSSFDLGMGKPLKLMKSEDQDSVLSLGPFEKDKTFESDIFGRGCCVVENYHKCESYRESKADMTSKIVANMEVTVANVGHIKGGQCSNLSLPKNSAAPLVNFEANRKEINGLTSFKKLPVLDNKDEMSEGASPSLKAVSHISLDEEGDSGEKITVQRELEDKWIHPIIGGCCENASILSNNSTGEEKDESDDYRGVTGVPSQYLNGSYVYTLTLKASPPSVDEVSRWLLLNDSGYSNCEIKVDDFLGGNLEKSLQECTVVDSTKAQILGESSRNFKSLGEKGNDQRQSECNTLNQRGYSDFSQDVSQISGPFGKLKATPLSQTGFRDPASFGMGQQLTLLSIEVQAESRGDLRSDPRFDAVNFIVLVFQEDGSSLIDVYLLIRINTDHERKNVVGITGCKMLAFLEEKQLFRHFIKFISSMDPDLIMGWDIQGGSLGFLAERAIHLGIKLLNGISRTPTEMNVADIDTGISDKETFESILGESMVTDSVKVENSIIEDEWGRTHASGVHVGGRIVLNIWRLMRGEVKLNMYTFEAVADAVLRKKIPLVQSKVLNNWFSSGPARARYRCIKYMIDRAKMNLEIMNQLDMINRTSELARVFGIEFFSVLSRGSQYRVESMLLRLARSQNYIAISPGFQQVASQPAMECIPLVMEPESAFYSDPVVVLDFQSLYPSMIIAYNLCFSTCLGNVLPSKANTLGVSSYSPDLEVLRELNVETMVTPNGVMYVPSKVRRGVLPRLLEEILSTRIMVKKAMKKLAPSQQVLYRIFNARQLALKLISNVTYGYTAAGFSGRMPCAEIADSIVQCGRKTLENAISFVNTHDKWKAKVVYGDTDSMFVLLKGRNVKEAFEIGQEIAAAVTAANPNPVTLKMEKVYHPCFLLTKKRYVGYSYENPDQVKPIFDAKGIETVRRDTCAAVAKTMEQSLRLFFEQQQVDKVKAYLLRQWKRIFSGRVSLQDFIFAKEVRLGTYSSNASASLPPAAIVATKAMREDPRAEPRYAERIPYVVVHGEPGSRLVDMVVDPLDLLALDSAYRLNSMYYIKKQIIPALQRVFGLVGADLNQWLFDMPRPGRESGAKRKAHASTSFRTRIDYYYLSKHCILCGEIVQGSAHVCGVCLKNEAAVASAIVGRTSKLEKNIHHLSAICRHCGGGDWVLECGVKCTSLACTLFYERRKVQKEMQSLCAVATEAGLYPTCMVEWF